MNEINLFCFPFAGGSKYSYPGYQKLAPNWLQVIPLETPGRGARIREPLQTNIELLIEDLFEQVKNRLDKPYAFYGHSMGTLLGFLLTKRILAEQIYTKPLHLFFTGCKAPSVRFRDEKRYLLPKDKFIEKLREYGGSPDAILQDEALMDFFEPILRADFEAIENYEYQQDIPLDIPMTILIGINEPTTYEDAMAWQKETTAPVKVHQFPGKHFFIFDHQETIMKMITGELHQKYVLLW